MSIKDKLVNEAKSKAKSAVVKIGMKCILPPFLTLILVAGAFMVVVDGIKDVANDIISTAKSIVSKFDNTVDKPEIIIDDKIVDAVKKELINNGMNMKDSYLSDELLKKSLKAYYSTQYPYIEGVDYDNDDVVKGCVHIKRNDRDLEYINYNSFSGMIGSGKSANDVENVKKYFSIDNDENVVIGTWSRNSTVTETSTGSGYQQEGSEVISYTISEYKVDYRSISSQYTMSYKFPIILANLYSNEGFGLTVADLGINGLIELTVLDSNTTVETENVEFQKINYKASGTYDWRNLEDDPLNTEAFEDLYWEQDYTTEQNAYQVRRNITETNSITIKVTKVDTWVAYGEVTNISSNTNTTTNTNTTDLNNDPDYIVDSSMQLTADQEDQIKREIVNSREGDITKNSIEAIHATISKKVTDHKVRTTENVTETTYTSSDMEIKDNTDKFLALIRQNENGEYDPDGELVKYLPRVDGEEIISTGVFNFNTNSSTSSNSNSNSNSDSTSNSIPDSNFSGSSISVANGSSEEKLNFLFPNGVPTTKNVLDGYMSTITVPMTNKNGKKFQGHITVHKAVVDDVKEVFKKAQDYGFRIYEAAGYNYRSMNNGSSGNLSHHSYGIAIDVNVNENYSHRGSVVYAGSFWDPNRSIYSIPKNGVLEKAFKAKGWSWGGNWSGNYQDYMHFSFTGH